MQFELEFPRRSGEELPPWQLGELAIYLTAYYDSSGQPPDGGEGSAEQDNQQPPDEAPGSPEETLPSPAEQTPLVRPEEFDAVFVRFRDQIYGFILHMVGNVESAQDLEQDTFMRAFAALSRNVEIRERALKAWLYSIAYNLSVDYLRRGKVIGFQPLPDINKAEAGGPGTAIVTDTTTPFDEQLAEMDIMREVLKRLTATERACILLDKIYDVPRHDIAAILEVKESGLNMRISRAHKKANEIAAELAKFKGE